MERVLVYKQAGNSRNSDKCHAMSTGIQMAGKTLVRAAKVKTPLSYKPFSFQAWNLNLVWVSKKNLYVLTLK